MPPSPGPPVRAPARRAPRRCQEPALCPLDQIRKRNYLCLLHISGLDCQKWQAALGHTDSVEEQPRLGTDRQTPTALPRVESADGGGEVWGRGWGVFEQLRNY